MAYYYYYQHQHTPSGPLTPVTTVGGLTTPLPPLLLLPPSQQHHLTLPLLTPILPSATTSVPMPLTETTIEHNQQHQLPTPNTFIRHCDDMGLFHDLQNIVVMSSLTGLPCDTVTTSIPVSTTPTLVTTSVSIGQPNIPNVCSSSSTGVITTMMTNPFDETFKQAVLQQKKIVNSASENIFSNNNNDGDLNTPFIATNTVMDSTNLINNSTVPVVTSDGGMRTTPIISAPVSVESMKTNSTTVPQQQQQNLFVTSTEATAGGVLVMMVEGQQQHDNPIVSVQSQNQQHNHIEEQQQQRFIIPATMTSTSAAETKSCHVQERHDDKGSNKNGDLSIKAGKKTSAIKQVLKQNLLVKRSRRKRQKSSGISETEHELKQQQKQNNDSDVNTINETNRSCNDNDQEDDENQEQQLKKKQKQDLLERNRLAAMRSRMKRKQKWELLFEENRKVKLENERLRETIALVVGRSYNKLKLPLPKHLIQQQKEITKKNKKNNKGV